MDSKEISAMTIEELDLSARTFNCFTGADAYTVQEILDLSKNHERARFIGNQAWEEVGNKLKQMGISLPRDISGDECNKSAGSENAMLPVPDAMLCEEDDSSQETKWSRTKCLHFERRVLILGQHGFETMTSEQPFSEVVQQSEVISHIYAKIKAPYNLLLKIFGEEEIISLGEDLRAYEKLASYALSDALTTLKPREEKALKLRYGIEDNQPRTLEETAREFNLTRERIRQIEAKALRKLRHPSRSERLRPFLEPTIILSEDLYENYISGLKEVVYETVQFQLSSFGSIREIYYPLLRQYYPAACLLRYFESIATYLRPSSELSPAVLNGITLAELVLPVHTQEMLYSEGVFTLLDLYALFARGNMEKTLRDIGLDPAETNHVIKLCAKAFCRKSECTFAIQLVGDFIGITIDRLEKLCIKNKHSLVSRYVPFDLLEVLLDLNYRSFEDLYADYKSGVLQQRGSSPRFKALYGDTIHIIKPYIETLLNQQFDLFRITTMNRSDLPKCELALIDEELEAQKTDSWGERFLQQWDYEHLPLSGYYEWFKIALKDVPHINSDFKKWYDSLIKNQLVGVKTLEAFYYGFNYLARYDEPVDSFAVEFLKQKKLRAMVLQVFPHQNLCAGCKESNDLSAEKDRVLSLVYKPEREFGPDWQKIMALTIDELDLGYHICSILTRSNISSVVELIQRSRSELNKLHLGTQQCDEIEARLQMIGLALKPEIISNQNALDPVVARVLDKRIDKLIYFDNYETRMDLEKNGIITIGDFVHTTRADLKRIRGLGPAGIKRISKKLYQLGLSLAQDTSLPNPIAEQYKVAEITRKKLYDEIWKISVVGVAKKYGIPYNQCLKQIKNTDIPIPPTGYWTKLSFGKQVEKIPLGGSFDEVVALYSHL